MKMNEHGTTYIRIGLLGISACMIAAGVLRGELNPLFVKAVNLCLECIGLG